MNRSRFAKDPAIHFLLIAIGVFAFMKATPDNGRRVEIGTTQQAEGFAVFQSRKGRAPNPSEKAEIIQDLTRQEILVAEARRLGLHKRDPIVQKRLVQKMEALAEKAANVPDPAPKELQDYYRENVEAYQAPATYRMTHHFFSKETRGIAVRSNAAMALKGIRAGEPVQGDPFLRGATFSGKTARDYDEIFGPGFSTQFETAENQVWFQQESSFGIHLVQITERTKATTKPLDTIQEKVLKDWKRAQSTDARAAWIQTLLDSYEVHVEEKAE